MIKVGRGGSTGNEKGRKTTCVRYKDGCKASLVKRVMEMRII